MVIETITDLTEREADQEEGTVDIIIKVGKAIVILKVIVNLTQIGIENTRKSIVKDQDLKMIREIRKTIKRKNQEANQVKVVR